MSLERLNDIIARATELTDGKIADLTNELAQSGATLEKSEEKADLGSTGGPTSLSTILAPLYLRGSGFVVPTLAVSGRPAGGIDILAQLPGYRTSFDAAELRNILATTGHAHFESGGTFAPADAALFRLRQQVGAQTLPSLVIASLLAKKVAVGVSHVGIDVRVGPHGNFGTTWAEARLNAVRLVRVAELLGMKATCFLTDASVPYQPFIGRREALSALNGLLTGTAEPELEKHDSEVRAMAVAIISAAGAPPPNPAKLRRTFVEHLTAQGSSEAAFVRIAGDVLNAHQMLVTADRAGFPQVNLGELRQILVELQNASSESRPYPDPAGVIVRVPADRRVTEGTVIASIRGATDSAAKIRRCFSVSDSPRPRRVMELVRL